MFRTQLQLWGVILIITPIIISIEVQQSEKCPAITTCPFRPQPCNEDDECNPDSNCCESPCGKICMKQLRTGCETLHNAASRRAKALGMDIKKIRTPRCNSNGTFEPIQCDNEIVSSCWCVDEQGFEIAGTKAPAATLVNCTAPNPCASHTCRMFCPHGFALNDDGCPLCKCRDPCENVKCPKTLDCQLEELACSDPPCPPIPTCKRGRSLENICPVGGPLRISETIRPFLCGNEPSKPTCPPLYQCLVQPGNDYGVCCPASLKIQKSGSCPPASEKQYDCGILCTHDLECPSVQKCCSSEQCGMSCAHPKNVTECFYQKTLSNLLAVNERVGRGYVPQCTDDGDFTPKQCSKNGLVCWCVDRMGVKLKGSMGGAKDVNCSLADARTYSAARSIDRSMCEKLDCAAICEYGFKLDDNGCSTCKCDDPCEGYSCSEDEECVVVRESSCSDFLCPTLPVCRPKAVYTNPCKHGTPLTDDIRGVPIACELDDDSMCPQKFQCTSVAGSSNSVCCPLSEEAYETNTEVVLDTTATEETITNEENSQTMCEYLKDFAENMEGTRDGMSLALPQPSCDSDGNYFPLQCNNGRCLCVDGYGTEIPRGRGKINTTEACVELRKSLDCLDLTCRMGCDYGYILEEDTSCPSCVCRDPCDSVTCDEDHQCEIVEVSCKDHYCPPVPVCLPKKTGQCPYLVPSVSTSCDFQCNSHVACNSSQVCCSNGCGTHCTDPLLQTTCQHHQALTQHYAHESGIPANHIYIPSCGDDGSYETKQCNPATKECWCVDFRGFEISQTRTSSLNNDLDCQAKSFSANCPLYECSQDCQHGFELDASGCRTCNCVDPCASVTCREEGESCRLVAIQCIDSPCPPIPMCLPKRENPCQNGEPLKIGSETVTCGPEYESCPSSHKCQLSPLGEYAVCCPKPRDVCFEPVDKGSCTDSEEERSLTRFHFNSKTNQCESFSYSGCHGNHNNFHSEEMCKTICPVLSQCERLREKNFKMSERYKKSTFIPRCDPENGNWKPVQCMEHVGVCWCVTPQGETQKGTVIRGKEPDCNFRQARGRSREKVQPSDVDLILEQLMMHIASVTPNENPDFHKRAHENLVEKWVLPSRCEGLKAQCDTQGKFLPAQCDHEQCWCVDEAGNQLPHTNSFKKGEQLCLPTPIEYVDVVIGFRGEYDDITATPVMNRIKSIISHYKGTIRDNEVVVETTPEALHIKFALVGSNKVDVAYVLEQMVKEQKLPGVFSDITKSSFIHQLGSSEPSTAERIIALEHREIVSQSPVSVIAPYHTAMIVIAAASAFVICTLTVLVVLYRKKSLTLGHSTHKVLEGPQRFLSTTAPIYIELPNEQLTPPPIRQDDRIAPTS